MSVARTHASDTVKRLLIEGHHDRSDEVMELPEGYHEEAPVGWLWSTPEPMTGLMDPASYVLSDAALSNDVLDASPAEALDGGDTAAAEAYCRRSLDVTMKGGTTSGVIYPLALCELARHFKFRNLGGASAGAIAASIAAAAELGRTRLAASAGRPDARTPEGIKQGRLRQGFAGVADVIWWLTRADQPADSTEEYRLVQLFKPTRAALPLFTIIAAFMRGLLARGAVMLLVQNVHWIGRAIVTMAFLLPPLSLALVAPWPGPWHPVLRYLASAVLLWLAFGALVPALAYRLTRPKQADPIAPGFEPPVAQPPASQPRSRQLLVIAVACLVAFLGLTWLWVGWAGYLLVLVHLFAEVLLVLIGFAVGMVLLLATAKDHFFGLIAGSGHAESALDKVVDKVNEAVLPKATVKPNLVDWLNSAMSDVAGQPDTVLAFGQLWLGDAYVPYSPTRDAGATALLDRVTADSTRRIVNLELMSTELTHRTPYRFPLPIATDSDRLYFDPNDFAEIFPPAVVDAMIQASPREASAVSPDSQQILQLRELPHPGDLPVVFATRASLALPGLFQALRLYQLQPGASLVRSDFGAPISHNDEVLRFPASNATAAIAEERWLTDGGVTSNFPVHMFDNLLPRWPTVGIDLGKHPRGGEHQDVYLPDAKAQRELSQPMGNAMLSFLSAILGTSLQWRDNAQLVMPAFQSRIAVVRQRSDEGGSNLFMTKDAIASLALRGMVAGMRLRRRFASEAQWRRHQWLRTRVAAENLADVQRRLSRALGQPAYAQLIGGAGGGQATTLAALRNAVNSSSDPSPGTGAVADNPLDWYLPDGWDTDPSNPLWVSMAGLGTWTQALAVDPAPLLSGAPTPAAELRQVPRT